MNAVLAEAYARLLAQGYDAPEGRIRNPGKFEGEPLYVPMYWDLANEGFANEGEDGSVHFPLDEEDWEVWPQLRGQHDLYLRETDQGFVGEISEEEFNSLGMEEGEEE